MAIDRIRFHLDENVDPDIATALRRHDVDVTTTDDMQLRTRGDSAHWEHAQREFRVIVTHDADFSAAHVRLTRIQGLRIAARGSARRERLSVG